MSLSAEGLVGDRFSPFTTESVDGWIIVDEFPPSNSSASLLSQNSLFSRRESKSDATETQRGDTGCKDTTVNTMIEKTDTPVNISSTRIRNAYVHQIHSSSSTSSDEHVTLSEPFLRDRTRSCATAAEEILGQQFEDNTFLPMPYSEQPLPASPMEVVGSQKVPTGRKSRDNTKTVCSVFSFSSDDNDGISGNFFAAPWITSWDAFRSNVPFNDVMCYCVFAAAAVYVVHVGYSALLTPSDENEQCFILGLVSKASLLVCILMVVAGSVVHVYEFLDARSPERGTVASSIKENSEMDEKKKKDKDASEKIASVVKVLFSSFLICILFTARHKDAPGNEVLVSEHDGVSASEKNALEAESNECTETRSTQRKQIRMSSLLVISLGGGALAQYVILRCS